MYSKTRSHAYHNPVPFFSRSHRKADLPCPPQRLCSDVRRRRTPLSPILVRVLKVGLRQKGKGRQTNEVISRKKNEHHFGTLQVRTQVQWSRQLAVQRDSFITRPKEKKDGCSRLVVKLYVCRRRRLSPIRTLRTARHGLF